MRDIYQNPTVATVGKLVESSDMQAQPADRKRALIEAYQELIVTGCLRFDQIEAKPAIARYVWGWLSSRPHIEQHDIGDGRLCLIHARNPSGWVVIDPQSLESLPVEAWLCHAPTNEIWEVSGEDTAEYWNQADAIKIVTDNPATQLDRVYRYATGFPQRWLRRSELASWALWTDGTTD